MKCVNCALILCFGILLYIIILIFIPTIFKLGKVPKSEIKVFYDAMAIAIQAISNNKPTDYKS